MVRWGRSPEQPYSILLENWLWKDPVGKGLKTIPPWKCISVSQSPVTCKLELKQSLIGQSKLMYLEAILGLEKLLIFQPSMPHMVRAAMA